MTDRCPNVTLQLRPNGRVRVVKRGGLRCRLVAQPTPEQRKQARLLEQQKAPAQRAERTERIDALEAASRRVARRERVFMKKAEARARRFARERRKRLVMELVRQGFVVREIAEKLGETEGAIAGVRHRCMKQRGLT